jgi:exopolysaccharide biosynthesis polyprenyl glycosylphosphotransferase
MSSERAPHNQVDRTSARRKRSFFRAGKQRSHVVSEALFASMLLNERKRADRVGRPAVLVRVSVDSDVDADSPSTWAPVIEALEAISRDADIMGWLEWRKTIGIVLTDVGRFDATLERILEARVRREIDARFDADARSRCSIAVSVNPASNDAGERTPWPLETHKAAQAAVKRAFDVAGSAFLLAVLSPLFLLIAALVKYRSPGPVFFRQVRVGEGGKPFAILKFRTMHANADHALHRDYVTRYIKSGGRTACAVEPGVFKLTNDPRITPVGRALRKTSLDELPQLWNVLRGEMSLVGPRPPIPYEIEQYEPWHYRRVIEAKPGITGLWQVTGRSRTTFDEMVRLDLRYAKTCSFWTDLKILLATPRAVITGRGAC